MNQGSEDVNGFEISHEKGSIQKANKTQFIVIISMFSFYLKKHLIVSK